MARKSLYKIDPEYILVTILLIFSGDPVTRFLGKYPMLIGLMLVFVMMYHRIKKDFYVYAVSVASALLLLFTAQQGVLGFVSWLGALNFINTFLFGGLIVYVLGNKFPYRLFVVVSYIAMISLVFYPVFNLLNLHPAGLLFGDSRWTYIIYTYAEQHHFRNCGLFWEPAAFAGILTLCTALNLNQLPYLWKTQPIKVIAIGTALVTTLSTSGYIIFFLVCIYYLLFFVRDKTIAFTLLPVLFVIGVVVYTSVDFLQQKLEYQGQSSLTLRQGEFSNTRFGSFIFDMKYIKKHPLVGNGFDESTRYADDPDLIQLIKMGANIANANGFSNYIACLGIPFMVIYLILAFRAILKIERRIAIITVGVILLSLFNEQWLNFPLFAGLIFFSNKKYSPKITRSRKANRYADIDYLPQLQLKN